MADRIFGEISGVPVGSTYPDRQELSRAGVHRPTRAGISGSAEEGADSIVLSGGYEDDEDFGDVIVYTGHGGQDQISKKQIADQELTRQNLALAVSMQQGLPVRVVRGSTHRCVLANFWHSVCFPALFLAKQVLDSSRGVGHLMGSDAP
jgi:putative restriction endonuclease